MTKFKDNKIKTWILVISGFRQTYKADDGSDELYYKLHKYNSPTVRVERLTWKENWRQWAGWIEKNSTSGTKILVFAYSYGAGHGYRKLAKYLARLNVKVYFAVLCDPVYRSWLLILRWLALIPWKTFPVKNTRFVKVLYQRGGRPKGHIPKEGHQKDGSFVYPAELLENENHYTIDRCERYHAVAQKVVEAAVKESK